MSTGRTVSDRLDALLPPPRPGTVGVAVSGGGDSLALLHLAADWAAGAAVRLAAVSVDHGLRPESAAEIALAAAQAAARGVGHDTLVWRGGDAAGNLQDAARRARRRLIAGWARERGIGAVLLGHTLDDQAETVLMRLARGSGVDGLSGMAEARRAEGILWLRPLLGVRREALRDVLRGRGFGWAEDPSNLALRFDRVRARRALKALADIGIDAEGLAATAARMGVARLALETEAARQARLLCRVEDGDVLTDLDGLSAAPAEIRRRLLAHVFRWIANAAYPPRHAALEAAGAAIGRGETATLAGCLVTVAGGQARATREFNAVRDARVPWGEIWDGRWRIEGPGTGGETIAALGPDGLAAIPRARRATLPATSLWSQPAVWQGGKLLAAPGAGLGNGFSASLAAGPDDFHTSLLSH